ncbi:MAG: ribonuclease, partial [Candidatus Atribacteria bacterium]|nr:ribonuclease [Candidatus Atribacteria bacterium]
LETIAVNFLRKLEEICGNTSSPTLAFSVGEELGVYLQGEGQKFLDNLEKLYGKEILWKVDSSLPLRRYNIIGVGSEEVREKMEKVI